MAAFASSQSLPQYTFDPWMLQHFTSTRPSWSMSRRPNVVGSQSSSCVPASHTSTLPGYRLASLSSQSSPPQWMAVCPSPSLSQGAIEALGVVGHATKASSPASSPPTTPFRPKFVFISMFSRGPFEGERGVLPLRQANPTRAISARRTGWYHVSDRRSPSVTFAPASADPEAKVPYEHPQDLIGGWRKDARISRG